MRGKGGILISGIYQTVRTVSKVISVTVRSQYVSELLPGMRYCVFWCETALLACFVWALSPIRRL